MPDTLSLSAGVSLGLLAGIVSGVCYLVASGFPRTREDQEDRRCISSPRDDGVCRRCGGDLRGGPIPCICFRQQPVKFESGAWFLRQVQRAISIMPWSLSTDKLEQIEEECDGYDNPGPSDPTRGELKKIREFLETISAKLAGGPLEGTRVAPLYDHPAYLPPPRNASPSSASSGASGAHVQLKRLVARVVEEAAAMPALARYSAEPHTPSIESSTYEDLLATAILNKVIERYQNENGSGGRSSGIHSASASPTPSERSSPRSLHSRHNRDITPPLQEEDDVSDWDEGEATDEALEVPRRVPFPEFGGDIVHNIVSDNEEREFDEVSGSDLQAVDGTWEENWLFQKKKIKTIQSVPVPMLVPNSNTEYRALIGDRDADDTTDLSDNASDSEEQIAEYKGDMQKIVDSKHVIGGKPARQVEEFEDFEPDSLTIVDGADDFDLLVDKVQDDETVDAIIKEINDNNVTIVKNNNINDHTIDQVDGGKLMLGIDSGPLTKAEFSVKEEIHRTLLNGNADEFIKNIHAKTNGNLHNGDLHDDHNDVPDVMLNRDNFTNNKDSMNTLSHHEREGEYEETVTLPVQRYADSLRRKHFDDGPQVVPTRDTDQDDELIPGSIAYRERKKWLNYVEMPNNPYSPEAIQKRLSTKSNSSLFDVFTSRKEDGEKIEIPDDYDATETNEDPVKEINHNKLKLAISNDSINSIGKKRTPSPRILKDVVADEIPQYKRYGRDYYIKEAKSSCGGRKKTSASDTSSVSSMNMNKNKSTSLDNFDSEFASPGLLIKQFNMIATNQHYTKFAGKEDMTSLTTTINNGDSIMIEYEDANDQTLFSATPIFVDDDTDKKFDEIIESAYKTVPTGPPPPIPVDNDERDEPLKSPISIDNSYISTSSMEDSIKIYNVQTGEIIKCKPEDNISARYESDSTDNIDIVDKNISEVDSEVSSNDVHETVIHEQCTVEEKLELESDDILQHLPKVKELAKKFVSMDNNLEEPVKAPVPHLRRRRSKDNILTESTFKPEKTKQMYMHSLTARSISKEFREELKLSMSTPLTVPGGSKEIPEGIEEVTKESSRPGSPLPEPGTIKTKLAFFESLKSKFSSK